jgi:hypothetical protein
MPSKPWAAVDGNTSAHVGTFSSRGSRAEKDFEKMRSRCRRLDFNCPTFDNPPRKLDRVDLDMYPMASPESPLPPRSPGFYLFRSHSSIPPPTPYSTNDSLLHEVLPHFTRQFMRSVTSVILPVVLLPFHFFFLFLSIMTTVLAGIFLSWHAFMVYLDIGVNTASQIYSDFAFGGRKTARRRLDLLRKAVDRGEVVRLEYERPRARGRGLTIG